eukprot:CFRG0265T1
MSTGSIIELGASEARKHEYLTLPNKLNVVIISDPETDKAAAALDVHVGHLHDPEHLPGLAHFCEHLLFLGTEKYPKENVFSEYLARHGGSSNAYTGTDHTNYYFDVQHQWLEHAIDIWSQFFVHPLFLESSKDKEIQAVNSEHEKNILQDVWRLSQLDKSTCRPDHVYNRFGTGNLETLGTNPISLGLDVRDELIDFYRSNYSANVMTLSVIGRQSLDELRSLVLEKFSDIPNTNQSVDVWPVDIYGPEQLQRVFRVMPVKEFRRVEFCFPIDDSQDYYLSKPTQYIAHLLGHEGPGSLLSILKTRGWGLSTMAGDHRRANGFGVFKVTVDVTAAGLDHVNDIGTLLFQYIDMIRREGVKKWIHDECASLLRMQLDFKDKEPPSSYVSSMASNMHHYPPEHVVSGAYLLFEYNPEMIHHFLDLFSPTRVRLTIVANVFEDVAQTTEVWYGTKYDNSPLDENIVKEWMNCGVSDDLRLPVPNRLIASDFTIKERDEHDTDVPSLIAQTSIVRLWHKHDDTFLLPKGRMYCDLVSPLAYTTPLNCVLTNLFAELLKDGLSEFTYAAELGGLNYNFDNTMYGISFHIKGYTHKMGILLSMIIDKIVNFSFDDVRFEVLKDLARQGYKNFEAEQPYHHCMYNSHLLSNERLWTHSEKLEVLQSITADSLRAFVPDLLSRVHVESFVHGNVSRAEAREYVKQMERVCLSGHGLESAELQRNRHIRFEDGYRYIYKKVETTHTDITATEVSIITGLDDTVNNVLIELFNQCIHEAYFNTLRTNEQLGYIVHAGLRRQHGVNGMKFIIQGSKAPEYLASRVDVFLGTVEGLLLEMRSETFAKHVDTLCAKKLEKPKTMSQESNRHWSEILVEQYHFTRAEVETAELKKIKQEQLVDFYRQYISPKSATRVQVCLLAGPPTPNSSFSTTSEEIDNQSTPRQKLSIHEIKEVVNDKLPTGKNALTTKDMPQVTADVKNKAKAEDTSDPADVLLRDTADDIQEEMEVDRAVEDENNEYKNNYHLAAYSTDAAVGETYTSDSKKGPVSIVPYGVQKILVVGEDVLKFKSTLGLYPQPKTYAYRTCLH